MLYSTSVEIEDEVELGKTSQYITKGKGKGIDSCYSAPLYSRFLWHHFASFGKKKDDQTSKMMTLSARSHESGCNLFGRPAIMLCQYEIHKTIGRPRFNNYWGRKVTPKGKAGQHLIFQPMQSKMFPPVALFRVKSYIIEK